MPSLQPSVYEGAHKKVLWAIVPRGSIQEEIKLFMFLKKRESPEQLKDGAWGGGNARYSLELEKFLQFNQWWFKFCNEAGLGVGAEP